MHITVIKYNDGDALNDKELDFLIDLHARLDRDLKFLGAKYDLARVPIFLQLEMFESYKRARQEKH